MQNNFIRIDILLQVAFRGRGVVEMNNVSTVWREIIIGLASMLSSKNKHVVASGLAIIEMIKEGHKMAKEEESYSYDI